MALVELNPEIAVNAKRRISPLHPANAHPRGKFPGWLLVRLLTVSVVPALFVLAGCGGSASGASGALSVSPGNVSIDTNCTGCNTITTVGATVEQFSAMLASGGTPSVSWTVSGGDSSAGAGSISSNGQYTPPPYLTADSVKVTVTATASTGSSGSATITVTPGFLQPLSPENVALGANGTVNIRGYIAEAGGTTGISYAVSNTATGSGGGQGLVSSPSCVRSSSAFTYCNVTYTAPSAISSTVSVYVVATVGNSSSRTSTQVLLNTAGISSNPATHQTTLSTPVVMGSSGGNNSDYDTTTHNGQTYIADCCGGTLGALIQNTGGTQYILSCNHVLARSDQAVAGEMIVQPGLIDDGCYPYGNGGSETPVGFLTAWLPLSSSSTNVDAAIAQVNSGAVNTIGAVQELGVQQPNGTLAAAPPGISSTAGKGENGSINMLVAKSGRTTGLTCASIATVSLDVQVSYFRDCAETEPYLTKTFINQIAIEGNNFSDAGDSGSLVVDAGNAEPVGLFFAGGVNSSGVGEGVASPAPTVLAELGALEGTSYTFVGTTDHAVTCLDYSNGTVAAAQSSTLSTSQADALQQALPQAWMLVSPSAGILGAASGKSSDHAGEAAIILYVDQSKNPSVPQTIGGVRTEVIPTTAQALAAGAAPLVAARSGALPALTSSVLSHAVAVKQQISQSLMKRNPAFFGVGVGQSLDNPKEATLTIFVDRNRIPATLPATIDGMRARYIVMDRLHVTRSYLKGAVRQEGHCMAHPPARSGGIDFFRVQRQRVLKLFR